LGRRWKTRKKGTLRQLGLKFPVKGSKKTLPKRLKVVSVEKEKPIIFRKEKGYLDLYSVEIPVNNETIYASVRKKGNTILIVDYWLRKKARGKGLGEKGLRRLRKKFDNIYVAKILQKFVPFWDRMRNKGLVDGVKEEDAIL